MKIILITFLIFFELLAYSEIENTKTTTEKRAGTYRDININEEDTLFKKTWNDSTNTDKHTVYTDENESGQTDENGVISSTWNAKDWQNYFYLNGSSGEKIGNVNLEISQMAGAKISSSGNVNKMTSDSILNSEDEEILNNESMNSWDSELQEKIQSYTTGHGVERDINLPEDVTIKCYMARNINISYKCEHKGQSHDVPQGTSARTVKKKCESTCFDEKICRSVVQNPTEKEVVINDIVLNSEETNQTEETTLPYEAYQFIETSSDTKMNKVTFDYEFEILDDSIEDENKAAWITIYYFDRSTQKFLANNFKINESIEDKTIFINDYVDKFYIEIKAKSNGIKASIKNIILKYNSNQQYFCSNQDISQIPTNNYAYVCPSENIVEFTLGGSDGFNGVTYKICADYGERGTNRNGTYEDESSCENACRKYYPCTSNVTTGSVSTELYKSLSEGCMGTPQECNALTGEMNPSDFCRELRITGAEIINEDVFDGKMRIKRTIQDGQQVQEVTRPRVLEHEDEQFEEANKEMWKDEAYQYMLNNQTFRTSNYKLNENTKKSSAYNMGFISQDGDIPLRGLYWVLKPKAFDVNEDRYFYSIIEAVFERSQILANGLIEKIKNKVLFVRLPDVNGQERYKAFAIKKDWARNGEDSEDVGGIIIQTQEQTFNSTANWEYKTFSESQLSWIGNSSSNFLEYFKSQKLELDNSPFLRLRVIEAINALPYTLKGRVRKKTIYGTQAYTGSDDGTGEIFASFTSYVMYRENTNITYADIIAKIDSIQNGDVEDELIPIYNSLSPTSYARYVSNDNLTTNDKINIFLYGKEDKKESYIQIHPETHEIDKKGFIFIFAY